MSIKNNLSDTKDYEVSIVYDYNGYTNKITIKD